MSSNTKVAFLFNANAKRVRGRFVSELLKKVPLRDVYFSRSKIEAERHLKAILDKDYGTIFCGGGDGTIMHAASECRKLVSRNRRYKMPKLGILKLGTGNALGSVLQAQSPARDVAHILAKGHISSQPVGLVECDDGTLAPFTGMGYDAEILNDFFTLNKHHAQLPTASLMKSLFGYAWAAITRCIPRHLFGKVPHVRVSSKSEVVHMVHRAGRDEEVRVPAGIIYEGPANFISVGAIPCLGFGFTLFPFVQTKPGTMQVRLGFLSPYMLLSRLYPSIWRGTFRHPQLYDYLVKDVKIESVDPLPFQVGGDACGFRNKVELRFVPDAIEAAVLPLERIGQAPRVLGLLPSPRYAFFS